MLALDSLLDSMSPARSRRSASHAAGTHECQRVECAFTSPVRTECGMFVMYCMLFYSAWMWCLEEGI